MSYPPITPFLLLGSCVLATGSAETVAYYDFESGSLASTGGSAGDLTSVGTNPSIATPFSNISFGGVDANDNAKVLYADNSSNAFSADAFTIEAIFQYQGASDVLASTFDTVNSSTNKGIGWLFGTRASGSENGFWFAYSTDGTDSGRKDIYSEEVSPGTLDMTAGSYYYAALSVDMSDTSATGLTFYMQDITTAGNSLLSVSATHTGTSIYDTGTEFTIGDIANASVLGGSPSGVNYTGPIDAVRYSNTQLAADDLLISIPEPAAGGIILVGSISAFLVARRRRS
tara:strand:- start:7176 stop:8033 length:858 start_codon:yes stop_codon:yes gene_type:complete